MRQDRTLNVCGVNVWGRSEAKKAKRQNWQLKRKEKEEEEKGRAVP